MADDLRFALYDLKQPACADIHEAVKTIDQIMYTLQNGTHHKNERTLLLHYCDALNKFIRMQHSLKMSINKSERLPPCPKCGSWTFCANIDEGYQILCSNDACRWKQKVVAEPKEP